MCVSSSSSAERQHSCSCRESGNHMLCHSTTTGDVTKVFITSHHTLRITPELPVLMVTSDCLHPCTRTLIHSGVNVSSVPFCVYVCKNVSLWTSRSFSICSTQSRSPLHDACTHTHTSIPRSQMDFLADDTLSPSTKVWPSLALLQEMSGRGSPSATQEIMAALPSTAVTFFSWVIWGWTGGHTA